MVLYVITLANSVIGVSVLALPFCFQKCGIVLATLMLICSAIMTRVACHFLLKGGTISRRRTYELLAYHTYGPTGKLLAELSIIGFLLGTLIAFLVVMGDLGPQIVSELFSIENNNSLRTIVMTALALFVALPLGLLKNIDSLGSVSIITLMFYVVLVCKILASGVGPLWAGSCLNDLNYWRPAGIFQCIPIFAMALSCQTQIFPIYDSLPEPTLSKMNSIVKYAVYLCTCFYFCVGFFGYVAFCGESVDGNILVNFKPTGSTQFIKCCFVFSIAFSFPLVVLPCRASLHSMIWRDSLTYHHIHEVSSNYIPEGRLRLLTVLIIGTTLVIGLKIPNIELVLGLVGSTAGSVICIIFPALMFISVTPKNTTEKLAARIVFVIGVTILVLTTYATLYAVEKANVEESNPIKRMDENSPKSILEAAAGLNLDHRSPKIDQIPIMENIASPPAPDKVQIQEEEEAKLKIKTKDKEKHVPVVDEVSLAKLQQPVEPIVKEHEPPVAQADPEPEPVPPKQPEKPELQEQQPKVEDQDEKHDSQKLEPVQHVDGEHKQEVQPGVKPLPLDTMDAKPARPVPPPAAPVEELQKPKLPPVQRPAPVPDPVVPPVQKGEPAPLPPVPVPVSNQTQTQQSSSQKPAVAPAAVDNAVAEQLLKQIEKQQEEQRKLIEEQKQVLAELKKHHEEHDQADADADAEVPPASGPEVKPKANDEPVAAAALPVIKSPEKVKSQSNAIPSGQLPAAPQIPDNVSKVQAQPQAEIKQEQKPAETKAAATGARDPEKVNVVDL